MKENKIKLKQLDKNHCHLLVKWLNQRSTNSILKIRNMTNIREQEYWFDNLFKDKNSCFYILASENNNIGFGALQNINWIARNAELFVCLDKVMPFTIEPYVLLCSFAFKNLNLNKISLDVLAENTALIKALEAVGFVKELRKRQHYFCNKSYHHVVELAVKLSEFAGE